VCDHPDEICSALFSFQAKLTKTGTNEASLFGSVDDHPSSLLWLFPQHHTWPSERHLAQLCALPAESSRGSPMVVSSVKKMRTGIVKLLLLAAGSPAPQQATTPASDLAQA
jgi:hypothetical protein